MVRDNDPKWSAMGAAQAVEELQAQVTITKGDSLCITTMICEAQREFTNI